MTEGIVIKLEGGKVKAAAAAALEQVADRLYHVPGTRLMVVAELQRIEHSEPDPSCSDDRKHPTVTIRTAQLEVAAEADQDEALRKAMQALYLARTASGTLLEDGDVELDESTLRLCAGILSSVEASKLRVALKTWAERAHEATHPDIGFERLRTYVREIAEGLRTALNIGEFDEENDDAPHE